jgi:hypothetical protein
MAAFVDTFYVIQDLHRGYRFIFPEPVSPVKPE